MNNEMLIRILDEEYGIKTLSELNQRIMKEPCLDISMFCRKTESREARKK